MSTTPVSGLTFTQSPDQLSNNSSSLTSAADLNTEFLQMMMTELKNQDPTQPVDDTQMISQQAQFSSLGEMQNMNTSLTTLLAMQNVSQATSLIGKTVAGVDGSGNNVSGTVTGITFANSVANLTLSTANGGTDSVTLANISSVNQ
jgi:flagellar basal-body rod modification protein FlgD